VTRVYNPHARTQQIKYLENRGKYYYYFTFLHCMTCYYKHKLLDKGYKTEVVLLRTAVTQIYINNHAVRDGVRMRGRADGFTGRTAGILHPPQL
jgi:hypothetical protein